MQLKRIIVAFTHSNNADDIKTLKRESQCGHEDPLHYFELKSTQIKERM